MKKCPECLTLYDSSERFCKKCGKKLKNSGSNSFRNFIIIIIITVLIIIIGLIIYFMLNNYSRSDLLSLFSKPEHQKEEESEAIDVNGGIILIKEKLSTDQKRVISLFGYPDQFTVIFDEGNDNKRIETWIYFDMEALFLFENGIYNDTEEYYGEKYQESVYVLSPQDFVYGMTPLEVETLISEKGIESIDENTGLDILAFGEGEIICIFNPDGKLIIASKQNKLSNDI